MRLYRDESSDAKTNAQRNLMGRTHYVDPDTLRFHKSRIRSARAISGGLLFYIVESCAIDHQNTRRGFRAVLFDIFGTVLTRDELEECSRSHNAAVKKLFTFLNTFDAKAHTIAAMERAKSYHAQAMADLAAKVAAVVINEKD